MSDRKLNNKKGGQDNERDHTGKSLQKLIEESRTKSEAFKKILKSLNTNKNRD